MRAFLKVVALFILGVPPAFCADPADRHLPDLDTWLHSKDSVETIAAETRLRTALETKGEVGEHLAQHLLEVARSKKPRRNLFDLLSARAFSFDEDGNIVPHLNGPYLKEIARMSIPDDANNMYFRDYHGAVAYLKLNREDHELYWRLRLAATRDAKVHQIPTWSLEEKTEVESDAIQKYLRDHYPRPVRAYGLRDAWNILIQLEVLKPGMSLPDAIKILGEPTHKQKDSVRWYLDTPRHVNPSLSAPIEDGKIVSFKNTFA